MREIQIVISDQSIAYLEHDAREPLLVGGSTRRASWILPQSLVKRIVFCVIRRLAGDHGKLAEWTRAWRGPWVVDLRLSGGLVCSGFSSRESAIKYEERFVLRNLAK